MVIFNSYVKLPEGIIPSRQNNEKRRKPYISDGLSPII